MKKRVEEKGTTEGGEETGDLAHDERVFFSPATIRYLPRDNIKHFLSGL